MSQLAQAIPDVHLLLALEPEELGTRLLFLLKKRQGEQPWLTGHNGMFVLESLEGELWQQQSPYNPVTAYPRDKRDQIGLALREAWAWLEAQGLIVPAPDTNGRNGWRVLSRRAQRMQTEKDFADYRVTRLLPKENLHPRLADEVWGAFVRGNFDTAALLAMKAVELSVREAAGYGKEKFGRSLMEQAFSPDGGPLSDMEVDKNERRGRMELFAGVYSSYRNPQAHRDVNLDDPHEALEIIYLANHLLRIVDARAKAKTAASV